MTERMPTSPDDDFYSITAGLDGDTAFTDVMAELDQELEDLEDRTEIETQQAVERYTQPHTELSLDNVVERLNKAFLDTCEELGLDPNAADPSVVEFAPVRDAISDEMYALKAELWQGDVVSVTDSLVVDTGTGADGEMHVLGIYDGDNVVGTFSTPVVGPMPDEMNAIVHESTTDPGMGVGFILDNPVVLDAAGNVHTGSFDGMVVIVSLNVLGGKLTKYVYPQGL